MSTEGKSILRKASIITSVVMALVMTACGGGDQVATTQAAAASTTATAETTTTTATPAETTTTATPVETTTTTAAPADLAPPDGTINVILTNFAISPVSLVVQEGEPIVLHLENRTEYPHTWALLTAGTQWTTWEDFDLEQILAGTQGIPADGTDTLEFIAPEPGIYQVVCAVRGHIERGMVAELVVEG